jgi:hypothetical protein
LEQLDGLREKIGSHAQLNQIYEALENILDKKVEENKLEAWKGRKRIGFKS